MSEVYPSDNELLNIESDSETGVEFIPTGQAPYYLQFRKLLYRFLLATKIANDFRVYDEGGLDIGVKSGKFWLGTDLITFAALGGNTLADDKTNIYLYIDANSNLVINEYSSFPDMTTVPHVRLATVTTSGGDIDSITDSRCGHNFVLPAESGGMKKIVYEYVADTTLNENQSGSVLTNGGATGTVTLTLPASAGEGVMYIFAVQAAQEFRIDPGIATIRDDSGQTANKYKSADAIGELLTLVADSNGDWITIAKNGTWTEEV